MLVQDVILNCELAYQLSGKPLSVKQAAITMLETVTCKDARSLLEGICNANAPLIYLNAAKHKFNYLKESV